MVGRDATDEINMYVMREEPKSTPALPALPYQAKCAHTPCRRMSAEGFGKHARLISH
jgi:hypothetical protein